MEINAFERHINHSDVLQTISISILINLKLINYSITRVLHNKNDGYFPVLFLLIYGLFWISIIRKKIRERSITKLSISPIFAVYIFIFIFWYLISYKYTETSMVQLICYVLFPIMICYYGNIDVELVLKLSMLLGIVALPLSSEILELNYYNTYNMDICYAFLPCIVSAIIDFFSREKNYSKFTYLYYIAPMYYLVLLLISGMRGTIMCIVISVVMTIFLGPQKRKLVWLSFLIIFVSIISVIWAHDIIVFIYNYFLSKGVDLYFLRKMISHAGDITNGRIMLWKQAIDGFIDSPIWGKGINSYNYWTGLLYPHNFVLQFLFEGGIVSLIWFILLFVKGTYWTFKNSISSDIKLYLLTFCISVPYLFVSANMWTTPLLWVFVGILIKYWNSKSVNNVK